MYKFIKELWKKPKSTFGSLAWRDRLVEYREEPMVMRISKPTRLDRARELGYKAKDGIIVVRSRAFKGMRKRPAIRGGRRPKRYGLTHFTAAKSKQRISEEHANRKYPNMEVLNSYWIADDSKHVWYEVILVDPMSPVIQADKTLNWICYNTHKRRAIRGLVHKTHGKSH